MLRNIDPLFIADDSYLHSAVYTYIYGPTESGHK